MAAKTAETKKRKKELDKTVNYQTVVISCVCGAEFESGSTLDSIRVDICSNCHPFFTGEKRMVDAEGRIDKFRKKIRKR